MKIQFPKQTTADVISALKKQMAGRGLADLVSMEDDGGALVLKISKLGTSVLTFSREEKPDGVVFNLSSEKIAFAHKAFKDEVKLKLEDLVKKTGGTVLVS